MNGHVDVSVLDEQGLAALRKALNEYPEVLANSSDELKQAIGLPVPTGVQTIKTTNDDERSGRLIRAPTIWIGQISR